MQSHTFSTYQITASFSGGDCSTPEVLGAAHNRHYSDESDAECDADDLLSDVVLEGLDPSTVYTVREVSHTIEIDPESVEPFDGEPTNTYNAYCQLYVTLDGERLCIGAMIGAQESDHGTIKASGAGVVRALCKVWWADSSDHESIPAWGKEAVAEALSKNRMALWRLVPEYEPETLEQILV